MKQMKGIVRDLEYVGQKKRAWRVTAVAAAISLMTSQVVEAVVSSGTTVVEGKGKPVTPTFTLPATIALGTPAELLNVVSTDPDDDSIEFQYIWCEDKAAFERVKDTPITGTLTGNACRLGAQQNFDFAPGYVAVRAFATNAFPEAQQYSEWGGMDIPRARIDWGLRITSSSALTVTENTAFSETLVATIGSVANDLVWELVDGDDRSLFELTGNVLSLSAQNFESAQDTGKDNTYSVTVKVTDKTSGAVASQKITVTVTDIAEAYNAVTSATQNNQPANGQAENKATLTLSDDGGTPAPGVIVNVTADVGTLADDELTTDSSGLVTASVTHNVAEPVTLTFSWTGPDGVEATATQVLTFAVGGITNVVVTDANGASLPDPLIQGAVLHAQVLREGESRARVSRSDVTHQWQRQRDGERDWTNIPGATGASYTTTRTDQGYRFRVDVNLPTPSQGVPAQQPSAAPGTN